MMHKMYARVLSLVLMAFILMGSAAIADDAQKDLVIRQELEARENNNRLIDVPGRGLMQYYAQRNPVWNKLRYENQGSATRRIFGDGGCVPTAVAMALAAFSTPEELVVIGNHTKDARGFSLCTHTVNGYSCTADHGLLRVTTPEDYATYLPVILGSYATGNNDVNQVWRRSSATVGGSGGTNGDFTVLLSNMLGLDCRVIEGNTDDSWLDALRDGAVVACLANTTAQPFSTGNGHFVTAVGIDDAHVYFFDPQNKSSYSKEADPKRVLEVIEPGLVKVKIENLSKLVLKKFFILSKPGSGIIQRTPSDISHNDVTVPMPTTAPSATSIVTEAMAEAVSSPAPTVTPAAQEQAAKQTAPAGNQEPTPFPTEALSYKLASTPMPTAEPKGSYLFEYDQAAEIESRKDWLDIPYLTLDNLPDKETWTPPDFSGITNQAPPELLMVHLAQQELGYIETGKNINKYSQYINGKNEAWCAEFISWCASQAQEQYGVPVVDVVYPVVTLSDRGVQAMTYTGRYVNAQNGNQQWLLIENPEMMNRWDYIPQVGDMMWMIWPTTINHITGHTTIISGVSRDSDGTIWVHVMEGNTPDRVQRGEFKLKDLNIYAYGTPVKRTQRVLASGSKGLDVIALKKVMVTLGYYKMQDTKPDVFTSKLKESITNFQKDQGLKRTGKMDLDTWKALRTAYYAAGGD